MNDAKKGRMTRSAAMFEAAGVSERFPHLEYLVLYTPDRGYFIARAEGVVQAGVEKVARFVGGDEYFG